MRLPSTALVPGDIVAVAPGVLSCDCVLLRGEVIADENMLTGESVPVRKVRPRGGGHERRAAPVGVCVRAGVALVPQPWAAARSVPYGGLEVAP